jgi:hypothetical protein
MDVMVRRTWPRKLRGGIPRHAIDGAVLPDLAHQDIEKLGVLLGSAGLFFEDGRRGRRVPSCKPDF